MKTLTVFDPAMCCSTGVCGSDVDQVLVDFSADVQWLKERGVQVERFVRKNKDDKISKEFYYLGRVISTGNVKQFVMPNTDKTAVEIEWELETPVREDIYQYIVNE